MGLLLDPITPPSRMIRDGETIYEPYGRGMGTVYLRGQHREFVKAEVFWETRMLRPESQEMVTNVLIHRSRCTYTPKRANKFLRGTRSALNLVADSITSSVYVWEMLDVPSASSVDLVATDLGCSMRWWYTQNVGRPIASQIYPLDFKARRNALPQILAEGGITEDWYLRYLTYDVE